MAIPKASINDIWKICEILGNEGVWKGRETNIKDVLETRLPDAFTSEGGAIPVSGAPSQTKR